MLRKRLRFSLRACLILIALIALLLAFAAAYRRNERLAATHIRQLGGSVVYRYPREGSFATKKSAQPSWSKRFARLVGEGYFVDLVTVGLGGLPVTDKDLELLKGLPKLEALYLTRTEISDAGLAHLKNLPNLRALHLDYTKVTDAGLSQLATLSTLSSLHLNGTHVTPKGLSSLRQALPACRIYVTRRDECEDCPTVTFGDKGNRLRLRFKGRLFLDADEPLDRDVIDAAVWVDAGLFSSEFDAGPLGQEFYGTIGSHELAQLRTLLHDLQLHPTDHPKTVFQFRQTVVRRMTFTPSEVGLLAIDVEVANPRSPARALRFSITADLRDLSKWISQLDAALTEFPQEFNPPPQPAAASPP